MTSTVIKITLDSQKRHLIRQQLLLILHCEGCHTSQCSITYCSFIKDILKHINNCTDEKSCSVLHCLSCRKLRTHWYQCFQSGTRCPVCSPFKEMRFEVVLRSEMVLNRQLRAWIQLFNGKSNSLESRRQRLREQVMTSRKTSLKQLVFKTGK